LTEKKQETGENFVWKANAFKATGLWENSGRIRELPRSKKAQQMRTPRALFGEGKSQPKDTMQNPLLLVESPERTPVSLKLGAPPSDRGGNQPALMLAERREGGETGRGTHQCFTEGSQSRSLPYSSEKSLITKCKRNQTRAISFGVLLGHYLQETINRSRGRMNPLLRFTRTDNFTSLDEGGLALPNNAKEGSDVKARRKIGVGGVSVLFFFGGSFMACDLSTSPKVREG